MKKLMIIPAYNEEENITQVIENIKNNADDFDYIIINDCSTDKTKAICKENNYNIIDLPVNLGIGGAVQTGYIYAYNNDYDIAVQFDGDGQHDAKYLDGMAKYMVKNNIDMLIGSRFIDKVGFQSSFARRVGIGYFSWLIKILTGTEITDPTSGFRMVNRDIIEVFCNYYPKDYPEPESAVTVLRNRYKVAEFAVIMKERMAGQSSINIIKSFYYMFKVSLAILIDVMKEKGRLKWN